MNIEMIKPHLEKIDEYYTKMMKGISSNACRTAMISETFEIAKIMYEEKNPVAEKKVKEIKTEIKSESKKAVERATENTPEAKVNTEQLLKWAKRQ